MGQDKGAAIRRVQAASLVEISYGELGPFINYLLFSICIMIQVIRKKHFCPPVFVFIIQMP